MVPNVADFKTRRPRFAEKHMKTFNGGQTKKGRDDLCGENLQEKVAQNTFRGSLGKFGKKSFATPKMCLLLNL